MQHQQLQQLQQLHQQNMRLAAAFSRSQAGLYNAFMQTQGMNANAGINGRKQQSVADQTNAEFEHFPTREVNHKHNSATCHKISDQSKLLISG
jgi:hypothetical protein